MKKYILMTMVVIVLGFFLLIGNAAHAGAHSGKVSTLSIAYDGTVTLIISDWVRDNCTCFAGWPNYMCLDRTRPSFKEEYALVLAAKKSDATLSMIIDESTCKVIAIEEF